MTPDPRTPTTDRVHGLPTDRSSDYPYGPPSLYDHPQNRIKNKDKDQVSYDLRSYERNLSNCV